MQLTHARLKHTVMSPLISLREIHIQNNHLRDNKQPYSHAVKLQDGRSVRIRLFALYEVSGSVPRSGNKQSGVFRW
ncbi:hypothetical protein ELE64_29595 [Klebsiella pneumoniae]|uniref:Uncharacterized protein n=1 Tax=Klebsiella variicola TaxID=244366 RepID=A0A2N5ANP0_KLEVA|nr:hypothetical protein [Klebsiella pneumoniae]PLC98006.1 hypothetical protein B6I45_16155 [Klebsiella quasipneumoniae]PLP49222.1 hypothetical protein CWM98_00755 [Klebsiella variicola]MBL1822147.1 hypothetical protein [Klebsiella pneumoniae]MBZ7901626.1 hypothetical protein [Klebsiella pneumoniae]